jgi:hypothetical protein
LPELVVDEELHPPRDIRSAGAKQNARDIETR